MKNVIASLIAVAGVAAVANAGVISYQVSNGGAFGASVDALPGQTVEVRVRIALPAGARSAYALNTVNLQPQASGNFGTAAGQDRIVSAANNDVGPSTGTSLSTPRGTVDGNAGQYGRVGSFGSFVHTTSTTARAFYGSGTAAGLARIAQARATNWFGTGTGLNNSTGAGGVGIAQAHPTLVAGYPINTLGNGDDNGGEYVFQFAIVVGNGFNRSITISTLSSFAQTLGFVQWFGSETNGNDTFTTAATTVNGTINVVPTPASIALLGLGGLVAGRRSRR
jgi:hypothetical protein